MSDKNHALSIPEQTVLDLFFRSEIILLYQCLNGIPEKLLEEHPLLLAVFAGSFYLTEGVTMENLAYADNILKRAEKKIRRALFASAGINERSNAKTMGSKKFYRKCQVVYCTAQGR